MSRTALIKDGIVGNVISLGKTAKYTPPRGFNLVKLKVDDGAGPGDLYDAATKTFTTPDPPPSPTEAELVEREIASSLALRGLVRVLAKRFDLTETQLRAEIKTEL